VNCQHAGADHLTERYAQVARDTAGYSRQFSQLVGDVVILFRLLQRLQAVTRDDMAHLMTKDRAEFVVIRESHYCGGHVHMAAGKGKAVDLASLNYMKLVGEIRTQTRPRALLTKSIHPRQSHVSQIEFLGHFAVKLHAQLDFVALV